MSSIDRLCSLCLPSNNQAMEIYGGLYTTDNKNEFEKVASFLLFAGIQDAYEIPTDDINSAIFFVAKNLRLKGNNSKEACFFLGRIMLRVHADGDMFMPYGANIHDKKVSVPLRLRGLINSYFLPRHVAGRFDFSDIHLLNNRLNFDIDV